MQTKRSSGYCSRGGGEYTTGRAWSLNFDRRSVVDGGRQGAHLRSSPGCWLCVAGDSVSAHFRRSKLRSADTLKSCSGWVWTVVCLTIGCSCRVARLLLALVGVCVCCVLCVCVLCVLVLCVVCCVLCCVLCVVCCVCCVWCVCGVVCVVCVMVVRPTTTV